MKRSILASSAFGLTAAFILIWYAGIGDWLLLPLALPIVARLVALALPPADRL